MRLPSNGSLRSPSSSSSKFWNQASDEQRTTPSLIRESAHLASRNLYSLPGNGTASACLTIQEAYTRSRQRENPARQRQPCRRPAGRDRGPRATPSPRRRECSGRGALSAVTATSHGHAPDPIEYCASEDRRAARDSRLAREPLESGRSRHEKRCGAAARGGLPVSHRGLTNQQERSLLIAWRRDDPKATATAKIGERSNAFPA